MNKQGLRYYGGAELRLEDNWRGGDAWIWALYDRCVEHAVDARLSSRSRSAILEVKFYHH